MTILDRLADHARERVAEKKAELSLTDMKRKALVLPKGNFPFEKALRKPGLSFLCECKKASPSKGLIAPDFPYLDIAKDYEAAGADAISVLTEPRWFLGADEYLSDIARTVSLPCLRKDFTVDEYMIYEAKALGAAAVLLICAISTAKQLRDWLALCDTLGLSALVEAHDEVDPDNSRRLRKLIPPDVLFVSESGVKTSEDVKALRDLGADAVLVGETLMRAEDRTAKLKELRGSL